MLIDGTLPPKPQKSGTAPAAAHICDKKMLFDRYRQYVAAQGIAWRRPKQR